MKVANHHRLLVSSVAIMQTPASTKLETSSAWTEPIWCCRLAEADERDDRSDGRSRLACWSGTPSARPSEATPPLFTIVGRLLVASWLGSYVRSLLLLLLLSVRSFEEKSRGAAGLQWG